MSTSRWTRLTDSRSISIATAPWTPCPNTPTRPLISPGPPCTTTVRMSRCWMGMSSGSASSSFGRSMRRKRWSILSGIWRIRTMKMRRHESSSGHRFSTWPGVPKLRDAVPQRMTVRASATSRFRGSQQSSASAQSRGLNRDPRALADAFGHLNMKNDVQIAASPFAQRQAMSANAHLLGVLGAGRDFDADPAAEGGYRHLGAEHGFPRGQVQLEIQVIAVHAVVGMLGETHAQKQVAGGTAADPGFSAAGQAQALTFADSGGNLDLIILDFAGLPAALAFRTGAAFEFAAATAAFTRDEPPQRNGPDRTARS